MPRPNKEPKRIDRKTAPPLTPEDRENQMISLAIDRAEEQLRDGTASAQVIVHYLRLATQKDRLERAQLEKKNELLKAKTDAIRAAETTERLYAEVMKAFRAYNGDDVEGYDDEDEEEFFDE
jgi:hypothetical protein